MSFLFPTKDGGVEREHFVKIKRSSFTQSEEENKLLNVLSQ
jgi:hypothetical protein